MQEQDIKNVIENSYEINIDRVEKSEESTDGNVYIIECKEKRYVLKIYKSKEHMEAMVNLHKLLEDNKVNAPRIIKNKYGIGCLKYENFYLVIYSFIEGKKLKELQMDNNKIKQVADYLRKLHNIDFNKDVNVNTISVEESDKKVLLHFDITKNNIFVDDDTIFFIDFDDAKYGPAVYDVAIAITNLFISRANGMDTEGIELFLDEYYLDDTKSKEANLEKIKNAAIVWLTETINNPNMTTSIREGLENKLNCINKLWSE